MGNLDLGGATIPRSWPPRNFLGKPALVGMTCTMTVYSQNLYQQVCGHGHAVHSDTLQQEDLSVSLLL